MNEHSAKAAEKEVKLKAKKEFWAEKRLRPMAAVAPRPSAAVSGQADEAFEPRGGAFLLAQGISRTLPLR